MRILVANLGSTSFKYRLFSVAGEEPSVLAKGGFERVTDHGTVIREALDDLRRQGIIKSDEEIDAVGFKTVLGHGLSGCVAADAECLRALEAAADLAPAHNPAYAAGIRQFQKLLPKARLVALFETAFYQYMPSSARRYAVPPAWEKAGIVRNGFHGASHKAIAERTAQLLGREDVVERARRLYSAGPVELPANTPPLRVISCHLGGSSSITAILNGVAIATSMGLSPQSGLPQNNRVGDLDAMAVGRAMRKLGLTIEEAEKQLATQGGLHGLSQVSNDVRDIREAAAHGHEDAGRALDFLIHEIRRYIGGYAFLLGGLDAICFTAGIGENDAKLRSEVLAGLDSFGIRLDSARNDSTRAVEAELSGKDSAVRIFVIPADEERVVALETFRFCSGQGISQ